MTFAEAVTKRTKELLFKNGISQYRLIKDTCLDKNTVRYIFKNKTKDIRMSTVYLIAKFFNMTISEFTNVPYFDNFDI